MEKIKETDAPEKKELDFYWEENDDYDKKIKLCRKKIEYYSKDALEKKYEDDPTAWHIIGEICRQKKKNPCGYLVREESVEGEDGVEKEEKWRIEFQKNDTYQSAFRFCDGYISIGENLYIAVYRIRLLLLLLIGCLAGVACYGFFSYTPIGQSIIQPIGEVIIGTRQVQTTVALPSIQEQPNITFFGAEKCIADEEHPYLELCNPEGNPANFQFEIIDTESGDVIAVTGVVSPGQYAYVKITDYYTEAGEYDVTVITSTYGAENNKLSGMKQNILLVVE